MNNGPATGSRNKGTKRTAVKIALLATLKQSLRMTALGIVIAMILTLLFWFAFPSRADTLVPQDDLGRPKFANPCDPYRENDKKVRAVIEIVSGKFLIPNQSVEPLRQFRNGDTAHPCPSPSPGATGAPNVSPGPTLRARLGNQVQLSFLNKALSRERDTEKIFFPYSSDVGCDKSGRENSSGTIFPYPSNDKYPNCFHGTATANIHFHGTHISPDGLGDNVLVQILADADQQDWTTTFTQLFDSGEIPEKWRGMPPDYRDKQMELIKKFDERLYNENQRRINAGEWPQYLMGAFPNFFNIPDFSSGDYQAGQAPGTHWYHAHKHGSTSLHIQNGLAGAMIIESNREGGYDHFIRKSMGWTTYDGHEKIFIFQQYDSTQHLMRDPNPSDPSARLSARPVLVNGMFAPLITMRPGEIQLWRLINATEGNNKGVISAGNSATGLFLTQGFTFRQTAQDGVQFSKDNYINQPFLNPGAPGGQVPGGMTLAAGNRVDLLVKAPATAGRHEFKNNRDLLFVVKVEGTPMPPDTPQIPTTWTEDWVGFLKDLPAPSPKENPNLVQFQWEPGRLKAPRNTAGFPPHFMINGKQFGEYGEVVDQCMPKDGLQDWIVENHTAMDHPFHIHINPFQVIQIDNPKITTPYAPTKNFVWQDVVTIPAAVISPDGKTITPGRVRIRHRFVDFTGTFVLHCHILAHEDRGMMQLVRVVPAKDYPKGCQINIPEHH